MSMRTRRHTTWLASGAALLLIASVSGIASAAPTVSDTTAPTWVDLNGNGVADGCETVPVVAADAAVIAANVAADLDGDGTISTSEAAQTDWVGGTNCNHGGYVSTVAQGSAGTCDAAGAPASPTDESTDGSDQDSDQAATETSTGSAAVASDACAEDAADASETQDTAPTVCEAAPVADGTTVDAVPMTHVEVAQSDSVGGKNCNHGGAVSESAKAAAQAAKAERDAARALRTHGNQHGNHGKHGGSN
jgi:hypothetical protein